MVLRALVLPVLCSPVSKFRLCLQLQGLEKYLMTKLYGKVFAASQSDRERDEALAQRMDVRVLQHCSNLCCNASPACRKRVWNMKHCVSHEQNS